MKKLLIAYKNVTVELPVEDEDGVETGEYEQEILDMDIVNEIFAGMYRICSFSLLRYSFEF